MLKSQFLVIVLILSAISCNNDKECCLPVGNLDNLLGDWQVYERGYSPGSGYFIDEVPDDPVQILTFNPDNLFSSNYQGLEDFSYYNILKDDAGSNILALFRKKREINKNKDTNSLDYSYMVEYENRSLRLYFRYCIEGCHISLKKI